jgi:hypothetical protein
MNRTTRIGWGLQEIRKKVDRVHENKMILVLYATGVFADSLRERREMKGKND